MPSKLLIAAADAAYHVGQAAEFGIQVPANWQVDGVAVMERVRRERDRFVNFVVKATEDLPAVERLHGEARFIDASTVQVGEHTQVEARTVVIATGSSPWLPPPFAAVREQILTSDTLFDLRDLPASLAVIGTGTIGLELGQALQRLGVQVAFFDPFERLGPLTDPALQRTMQSVLGAELELHLQTQILAATPTAAGMQLQWQAADGAIAAATFQQVLVAAGRRPNLQGLALENTGLRLDEKGNPPWNPTTTQCGQFPIFMAGDVNNYRPLLHEAAIEGRMAGRNAMRYPHALPQERRTFLSIAFTHPQMAIVGDRYADLDLEACVVSEVSFADQGRARVMGQNQGLMRLYANRNDGRLRGAELFGPQVEHLAHLLAWVMQAQLCVPAILELPFYHPTLEESLRTALQNLAHQLRLRDDCRNQDFATSAGN